MSANKTAQLEHTVMELGAELFRLKTQIAQFQEHHERAAKTMKALRGLLDDKGVITTDDFDLAIDLTEIVDELTAHSEMGHGEAGLEELKKNVH